MEQLWAARQAGAAGPSGQAGAAAAAQVVAQAIAQEMAFLVGGMGEGSYYSDDDEGYPYD